MIIKTDNQNYTNIAAAIREKNGKTDKYKPSEMAIAIEAIDTKGIYCTLTITTTAGATVTATLSGTTVTAKANSSGVAVLELPKDGTWTVTATADGQSVSIQVNTVFAITTKLELAPPADPVLANNTWEVISATSKAGKAQQYWKIGDTKNITVNGTAYTARIIGFDHDNVANSTSYGRTKAGITFELTAYVGTCQYHTPTKNEGGWGALNLRNVYIANCYNNINADLKAVIVSVRKTYVANVNTTALSSVTDNLFVLSEQELIGRINYALAAEGTQYAYYKAGNGFGSTRWLRSIANTTSGQNRIVYYSSAVSDTMSISSTGSYNYNFAFCV